ncbi:hypothetical protein BH160DRAFT_0274 [Burkholderia sp. H160]|nr:hypothetical protein BH160DRAFT_0274 [Burkholderia sp. H160]
MDNFSLFGTPIFVYDMSGMKEVNLELTERLQAESSASPGVRRANVGGWHSPPNIASRTEQCYRHVTRMIINQVGATHSTVTANNGLESGSTFMIRPRSGMLVVFPGWLQHYVHPYRGTRPRIIIASNVVMSPSESAAVAVP